MELSSAILWSNWTSEPPKLIENCDSCGWVFIHSNKREMRVTGSHCKRHQGTGEMGWDQGDFGLRKTSIKRDLPAFKYMKCYHVHNADSLLSTPLRKSQRKAGLGRRPSSRQKEFSKVEGFKSPGCQGRSLSKEQTPLH